MKNQDVIITPNANASELSKSELNKVKRASIKYLKDNPSANKFEIEVGTNKGFAHCTCQKVVRVVSPGINVAITHFTNPSDEEE